MISFSGIKIKNFRSYHDTAVSFKEGSGIVAIAGDNGLGKSTLLNAFGWCLYGEVLIHTNNAVSAVSNYRHSDEATEVSLEVNLDGRKAVLTRIALPGDDRGNLQASLCDSSGNWRTLEPAECFSLVKKILPKDIRHLFIFNGDQLSRDIFSRTSTHNLKSSIYKVSEIDIIDKAIAHLALTEKAYLSKISGANKVKTQIDNLDEDIGQAKSGIEGCTELIDEYTEAIKNVDADIKKLDEKIQDIRNARDIIATRDALNDNLKDVDSGIETLELNKMDEVQNNFAIAMLGDYAHEYHAALSLAKEDGQIPPPVDPKITKQILTDEMCICGRHIGEKEKEFIEKQHAEYTAKKKLQFLTDGIFVFANVDDRLYNASCDMKDILTSLSDANAKKNELQRKIEINNERLAEIDADNMPDDPDATHAHLEKKRQILEAKRVNAANQLDIHKSNLREYENKRRKLIDSDTDISWINAKLDRIHDIDDMLREVRETMETSIRAKLQAKVSDAFFSIFPDSIYKELKIGSDYSFSFTDSGERTYRTDDISVGQSKALVLSIVYALSDDLGYSDTPLLIDNLYQQIKETHARDLTEAVEFLAKDKQIIIIDLEAEKRIALFKPDIIKQELVIKQSDTSDDTVIEEVKNAE